MCRRSLHLDLDGSAGAAARISLVGHFGDVDVVDERERVETGSVLSGILQYLCTAPEISAYPIIAACPPAYGSKRVDRRLVKAGGAGRKS